MKLDPKIAAWMARLNPETHFEAAHRHFWLLAHKLERDAPQMAEIRTIEIDGGDEKLKARLYVPVAAGVSGAGLIFFHGGAFVVGDLDSHEMICRRLAHAAGMRVLSVEYRLSPKHRFPCAVDDVMAATRWVAAHGDEIGMEAGRLAVGGDSAGGCLAAVVTQQLKPELQLRAQLLIYPLTQWVEMTPSQMRLKEGYMLTQAVHNYFKDKYLRTREDGFDVRASPLLAKDLSGLPPAYIITGGYDPLRDEGKAYADKLAAHGVPVVYREYSDQPHGFFSLTAISHVAKQAIEDAGVWLTKTLA